MNRPLFVVGTFLVAAGIIGGAVAIATHDRWDGDDDRTIQYRLSDGDGDTTGDRVVVVEADRWSGPRFVPFFPLIIFGGVLITIAALSGRRRWGGPGDFESWHREAHWNWGSAGPRQEPPAPPAEGSQTPSA